MSYTPLILSQVKGGSGSSNFSGNLTLISNQDASTSASLQVLSGLTGYNGIKIVVTNMILGTATASLNIQFAPDAGVTWNTANYQQAVEFNVSTPAVSAYYFAAGGNPGLRIASNVTSTDTTQAIIEVYNFSQAAIKFLTYKSIYTNNTGPVVFSENGNGRFTSATAMDSLQILPTAGSITSGNMKVYGIV